MLRIRDILVRIRTYGQWIRYLTQDLVPDPGIFFSDQDDNNKKIFLRFFAQYFLKLRSSYICAPGTSRTDYTQSSAAHIHLLYPSLPRTCLCAESVWWSGCRAPTAARVLQALRAPRVRRAVPRTILYSTQFSAHLESVQCGDVTAHCAYTAACVLQTSVVDPDLVPVGAGTFCPGWIRIRK